MKVNRFLIFIFFLNSYGQINAQSTDFDTIMQKGVSDYETEKYESALSYFKQAFKLNRHSNKACYYLSLAYMALDNYPDAATYSAKVISRDGEYIEDAYLVNASAWDNLGRHKKATKIYKQALKKWPTNYLLHYNMALSFYNDKKYIKAQEYATNAIEIYPAHASSHILLAYIMFAQGERIQSMLPLYYFLLLEPKSDRSTAAYELLNNLWNQGVRQKGQRDIQLVQAGYKYDDFASAELAISSIKASENLENSKKEETPTDNNLLVQFAHNNNALFNILEETSQDKNGFWWDFYVNFFSKLQRNKLTEPFSYYISTSRYNTDVLLWISGHPAYFQKFSTWMEAQ